MGSDKVVRFLRHSVVAALVIKHRNIKKHICDSQ